jgi:hypothetical protein
MRGTPAIPFTSLIRDTIATHGLEWAVRYYYKRLPMREARLFLRSAMGV